MSAPSGMLLPSFFAGSPIARYGVLWVMLAGVLLLASHVWLSLSDTAFYSIASALVMQPVRRCWQRLAE